MMTLDQTLVIAIAKRYAEKMRGVCTPMELKAVSLADGFSIGLAALACAEVFGLSDEHEALAGRAGAYTRAAWEHALACQFHVSLFADSDRAKANLEGLVRVATNWPTLAVAFTLDHSALKTC